MIVPRGDNLKAGVLTQTVNSNRMSNENLLRKGIIPRDFSNHTVVDKWSKVFLSNKEALNEEEGREHRTVYIEVKREEFSSTLIHVEICADFIAYDLKDQVMAFLDEEYPRYDMEYCDIELSKLETV